MFYGLSKFLKNILPKSLFYRALLIVAVPVLVLQLVITIVFFDSLWIKTTKGMTRALVNEISTFLEVYNNENYNKEEVANLFSLYQDLNFEFVEDKNFNYDFNERWFSPIDRTLRRELKSRFNENNFWFDTTNYKELIDVRIKYENGYFKFLVPKDRVTTESARIFALWITVPALIMILISLIFLKNQTRPITNLARAAEKFGKGEEIDEFKPSGASEIRQAGYEFDKMRKRIVRHLNQRSEMLSGISHDLRTPLTRMKLQIAFIKDKELNDVRIKYGTKVNIELNKNNDNLFIKVEDDGPGIPEKEFDNVFKPFYKISKGRADSKSSVGLGLSIASDIIRSHGGNIRLEKSPMNGLGVKIFLPV